MKRMMFRYFFTSIVLLCSLFLQSCSFEQKGKEVALYENQCASCHALPAIGDLPRDIWETKILPEMAARMGIRENGYDPYRNVNFTEHAEMLKTGIYPSKPRIKLEDWALLKDYILSMAPDSLLPSEHLLEPESLSQFSARPISLDDRAKALFTYLHVDRNGNRLVLGDMIGNLLEYDFKKDTIIPKARLGTPLVDHHIGDTFSYATTIGSLAPSALNTGAIFELNNGRTKPVAQNLHRPSHTLVQDLNGNGKLELVVSEFGDLTGGLSLLVKNENGEFDKKLLLNQPGTIRVVAKDMDDDDRLDLVVATAQGDEGVSILFQKGNLDFVSEKVIRLSPVYGSSWFELIDFDGDGDDDIVTVNGDNADESYVHKPYHGIRLHLNDGNNHFEEKYFYPVNGATRVIARDFDKDGDIDFAVLSTFPDYKERPDQVFVYLENTDAAGFVFVPRTFDQVNLGRWFLMDAGDIDQDGDDDIVLSAFTLGFTPAPDDLSVFWKDKKVDLMVLENKLEKSAAE